MGLRSLRGRFWAVPYVFTSGVKVFGDASGPPISANFRSQHE